ncbi:GNAT family N-acetyltransferase [Actinocorallia sp. API 0066]|uniref:GNAT family N-acetyltransferase n=1 Tax=Actinocorallia sp. API 0066 TaxID=2896846 RepID=UPI001E298328|nr:GNAT family N-acetyltransferase [Actinocorallia sp. API 0066]MCD0449828.1 GNAT family N-acetyltransferase [Actinocorallia sp. API 0066]
MRQETVAGVVFREAGATDVTAVVALVESAYRGESSRAGWTTEADLLDGRRTDESAVAELVGGGPDHRVLLAESDGDLVACCHLERRGHGAYFGMFAVRPTLQGGGLGRLMLAEAERVAHTAWHARELRMTVISVRAELLAWYQRRGYHPTGETLPFPHNEERFGLPRRPDLTFTVLTKPLP